jgi:hypothetical protein
MVWCLFSRFHFYLLPYFETMEDAEKALDTCKDDYLLLAPKLWNTQRNN